jgi:hypothetical protein
MSKKRAADQAIGGLFNKTNISAPASRPAADDQDHVRNVGVSLRDSEWGRLQAIADQHGVSRNSLATFLLRNALGAVEAGKLDLPIKTINVIDIDE